MTGPSPPVSGLTRLAAVVGSPIRHSLSPLLHNAWIRAAGLDAVYIPLGVTAAGFEPMVHALRGGPSMAGINVTLPFKATALEMADEATKRARQAGAANVLVFREDGAIVADNTDGLGLLAAFAAQAPTFQASAGPVSILGAGGAALGAVAALLDAGCPQVRIVNRTLVKALALADTFGDKVKAFETKRAAAAFADVVAVVNATSAGLGTDAALDVPLHATPPAAVVMDMTYRPLITPFLAQAQTLGRTTVDGLEMLIGQARPAFTQFFGVAPPAGVDVRALALAALEAQS